MILKTKEFKETAAIILAAIDNSEISTLTDSLELVTRDNVLYLNVTNKEYYASVKFALDSEEDFHATVNAKLFLKLVAAVTTENIELVAHDTYITVKANGTYKIPLIFENDQLMILPTINIDNVTVNMNIGGDVLGSILQYNSKELLKASFAQPVQKLYYIDQEGCITFTRGACVNSFTLEKPLQVLINDRLVKLFKLFKNDMVAFKLGYDPLTEKIIQTKVAFSTDKIKLIAVTDSDDTLLSRVPVNKIRSTATHAYENVMVINKEQFLQAVNRLSLFNDTINYGTFTCDANGMEIKVGDNVEAIASQNGSHTEQTYVMVLPLDSLKNILSSCNEQYITLNYGNNVSIVITRGHIRNVIPEAHRG